MFTNWSRPPLGEQVTHCRGMHNLPMNCCIFCLLYLHFSKEKKKQVFPDKDIFCFWWMKLVCISLETANEFILGTGMKPLICFTWVPSDGKKKKKKITLCHTAGLLITEEWSDLRSGIPLPVLWKLTQSVATFWLSLTAITASGN